MSRLDRAAIVVALVKRLRAQDSWTGETHVQKAVYFLQRLLGVPTGWSFTLYKFGPFSFELRDELTEMRADSFLNLEPQRRPYGPRLSDGSGSEPLLNRRNETVAQYESALDFIAERLGPMGVGQLERIATALYVTDELGLTTDDERAAAINNLKPHVEIGDALESVRSFDELRAAAPTAA